jgi:hypothetical protein
LMYILYSTPNPTLLRPLRSLVEVMSRETPSLILNIYFRTPDIAGTVHKATLLLLSTCSNVLESTLCPFPKFLLRPVQPSQVKDLHTVHRRLLRPDVATTGDGWFMRHQQASSAFFHEFRSFHNPYNRSVYCRRLLGMRRERRIPSRPHRSKVFTEMPTRSENGRMLYILITRCTRHF